MTSYYEIFLEESGLKKHYKGDESLNVRLYHDLNIYGDIAESYIELLRDNYNVDVSKFEFSDYFPCEFTGDSFLESCLYTFLPFLKNRYSSKKQFKPITFSSIKRAIENGVLE